MHHLPQVMLGVTPTSGGGTRNTDYDRESTIALERSTRRHKRAFPHPQFQERGHWIVSSADNSERTATWLFRGDSFPTATGPRRWIFAIRPPVVQTTPQGRNSHGQGHATLAGLRGEAVIEAAYLVASQSLQRLREEAANRDEDEVLEVQPAEVHEFVICKSYLQSPPSC